MHADEEPVILESQKGGKKLAYGGYMYVVHSSRADGSLRWRCTDCRKRKCYGSVITNMHGTDVRIMKEHVHDSDRTQYEIATCRLAMKHKAQTTREKPGVIYSDALTTLNDTARSRMPPNDVVKRTLRNHRSQRHPPIPNSLKELVIAGDYTTIGGMNKQQFLIYDNGTCATSRIIVFASEPCLSLLGSASKWFMDGNFAMAPKGFLQVRRLSSSILVTFTL